MLCSPVGSRPYSVASVPAYPVRFAVIGEALIDLAGSGDDEPWLARPGGSPYNVAVGLARLERPTAFVGRISADPLGTVLREHAERSGVDLSCAVTAGEPSTVALVTLRNGHADYRFGVDGTADFSWRDEELADLPGDISAVHFGSLASWLPPGDAVVARRIASLPRTALVSYDPNVRPALQPDRAAARSAVESAVALADVVKTSSEDLDWLYGAGSGAEMSRDDVAALWRSLGATLVVITAGGDGATAFHRAGRVHEPARPVRMVDTVGAGDAFMSGLLDALAEHRALDPDAVASLDTGALHEVLGSAALVAALTCARAGANPPRRAERDAAR